MFLNKNVFYRLLEIKEPEVCGFIYGKRKTYTRYYLAKNKAKNKNEYEIGFIDKVKFFWQFFKTKSDHYAVFHVHSENIKMSKADILYAADKSCHLIVCKDDMELYRVVKSINKKIVIKTDLVIV